MIRRAEKPKPPTWAPLKRPEASIVAWCWGAPIVLKTKEAGLPYEQVPEPT